jgi:hypothetical protein
MRGRGLAALLLASCAIVAMAQGPSGPYFSKGTKGRVVDADTGQAIEGVIVVGRWEWRDAFRGHSGITLANVGTAVHVGEALTDRDGRFTLAPWGPKAKVSGEMEANVPKLLAFKSGYEPAQQATTAKDEAAIRLKKSSGEPKDQAQKIADFQGRDVRGGLYWRQTLDANAMPRMILALHREKERLGLDGEKIWGANVLQGRAGGGEVLDGSGQAVSGPVVWIEWTMRRVEGGSDTRRVVQTKRNQASGFWVSPWRLPAPKVAGWQIDLDAKPLVRAYAKGYKHGGDTSWEGRGGSIRIAKLTESREALLEEARSWRRDIDKELANVRGEEGFVLQRAMLDLLQWQCNDLTPDLRTGICFGEESDVGRYLKSARGDALFVTEDAEGTRVGRIVSAGPGVAASNAMAARAPASPSAVMNASGQQQKPAQGIGGFRIEPAR